MTIKVFKSNWTWRTIAYQDNILSQAIPSLDTVPTYIDDEGLEYLFRPTSRKEAVTLYVSSVGVLGTEAPFVKNIGQELNKRKWRLISIEENLDWKTVDLRELLNAWQDARINGAAKIGARISAERKRARIKMATDRIRERWGMPSNVWPTRILLEEVDISLNSAKSILGNRPIAQANYRAKEKRKERSAKGVRYKRADNYIDEAPDYAKG